MADPANGGSGVPQPNTLRQLDLRRTNESLGGALNGYGLTPRSAKERAAVVRAVTTDQQIRQRPMPVVLASGLVALVGLTVFGWQLYSYLTTTEGAGTGPVQPSLLLWIGLATFLIAAAVCSWAWQLYDVKKAIVMWLAIAALSVVAVVVIVIVLVALKGDGDADVDIGLDGLLDKITGGPSRAAGGFVNNVVVPVAVDTLDAASYGAFDGPIMRDPESDVAAGPPPNREMAPPGVPACPSCGRALTPGLLVCPRCGSRVDGVG